MRRRIILAGGSGFLGQTLASYFKERGFEIVVLTRTPGHADEGDHQSRWDGRTLGPWQRELEDATAVINLTGKSVNCRYHARNRQEILDSRVNSTRVLGEAIKRCIRPPEVWLNASTATLYRHTFSEAWNEAGEIAATPEAKDAFSIEVGQAWERTFNQAETAGTRKVAMRLAMVLGMGGNSVFPVLRRLVRFGLGGKMGSGRQFVSWIHEVDFCRAAEWLIGKEDFHGPINIAAPNPITNEQMMNTLRKVLGVQIGLPATQWMLEIGAFFLRTETELIIKSRRVIPCELLESGFQFQFATIAQAFENLCSRRP
jgi:uncharacterized protein (TIGR01777 family)